VRRRVGTKPFLAAACSNGAHWSLPCIADLLPRGVDELHHRRLVAEGAIKPQMVGDR